MWKILIKAKRHPNKPAKPIQYIKKAKREKGKELTVQATNLRCTLPSAVSSDLSSLIPIDNTYTQILNT
jgi:hypothetical protein